MFYECVYLQIVVTLLFSYSLPFCLFQLTQEINFVNFYVAELWLSNCFNPILLSCVCTGYDTSVMNRQCKRYVALKVMYFGQRYSEQTLFSYLFFPGMVFSCLFFLDVVYHFSCESASCCLQPLYFSNLLLFFFNLI